MARQVSGNNTGFVGKLGTVVGYRWKNIWCMRTLANKVNNPRTEAQQEHRSMFKQEVQLAGRMRWAVNIGLKELSDQMDMTAQNLFVKANQQAFSLVDGQFTVDYSQLCISAGPVAPVEITSAVRDEHNVLTVSFEKNPLHLSAGAYDNVYIWAWCPEIRMGYLANPVYRRTQHMSTVLPSMMDGKEIHLYAFVQDERGRCSNTAYSLLVVGMEGGDGIAEGVAGEMGVNLSGADTFVAEHLLDGTQVGTVLDKLGGKAVP